MSFAMAPSRQTKDPDVAFEVRRARALLAYWLFFRRGHDVETIGERLGWIADPGRQLGNASTCRLLDLGFRLR